MSQLENLKQEYNNSKYLYSKLCEEVYHQIKNLINQHDIKLAVPIEYRVKELSSVIHKFEKYGNIINLSEINDLVGLRIITVFETDIQKVCEIIEDTFEICRKEDTSKRLKDNQFGYGSIHYEAILKRGWCDIPSLTGLEGLKFEIQIRTAAQHIWAISSHILQYKKEKHVPDNVKRSINRVAALLELVDLEFLRVLEEQEKYIKDITDEDLDDEFLNVESLKYLLETRLPRENIAQTEEYDELLDQLYGVGINTTCKLRSFIDTNLDVMLESEKQAMESIRANMYDSGYKVDRDRFNKGVFYNLIGLVRQGLKKEFGADFRNKVTA